MTIPNRIAASWGARLGQALLVAALLAGPAAFGQPAGHQYTVALRNMDYGAMPSGLKVGDSIVWTNHDTVVHSVTARDHSFDMRLNPGKSATLTLSKAGQIPFYCLYHPNMRGTLTVAPK